MARKTRNTRPHTPRSPAEYGPLVKNYHALLRTSGSLWDLGHGEQTISLVAALRVLLVDRLLDKVVRLDPFEWLTPHGSPQLGLKFPVSVAVSLSSRCPAVSRPWCRDAKV